MDLVVPREPGATGRQSQEGPRSPECRTSTPGPALVEKGCEDLCTAALRVACRQPTLLWGLCLLQHVQARQSRRAGRASTHQGMYWDGRNSFHAFVDAELCRGWGADLNHLCSHTSGHSYRNSESEGVSLTMLQMQGWILNTSWGGILPHLLSKGKFSSQPWEPGALNGADGGRETQRG